MNYSPTLRRNQVIAPFGVGAIHVLKGSRAVVTAGLDYWFKGASSEQLGIVRVQEPRLQSRLGVSHFRLPPGPETELPGAPWLEIPLFRFPTWYVCPRCHLMDQRSLTMDGDASCSNPSCDREIMRQMSFAAACDHGHLQDFPWKEWVHRERTPSCQERLTYHAGGSGSLGDIEVRCGCCKRRNLLGIMSGRLPEPDHSDKKKRQGWSALTSKLLSASGTDKDPGDHADINTEQFHCQGGRVWLGECLGRPCARPLRAVLINATNVHYAKLDSALWIPAGGVDGAFQALRKKLDSATQRQRIGLLRSFNISDDQIADNLIKECKEDFGAVDRRTLIKALTGDERASDGGTGSHLSDEQAIRYPEYLKLQELQRAEVTEDYLEVRIADTAQLPQNQRDFIASISLVDRLRETRVMAGFSRLIPGRVGDAPPLSSHMWLHPPDTDSEKWLPAAVVYGEGIFIRLAEEPLRAWELKPQVSERLASLQEREDAAARRIGRPPLILTPRFVLLHTLAHLLIRRLVFECGYGSTSLRERLYVSSNPQTLMSGMLIYTASGDCEGSMGGLVRMGEPVRFARTLEASLEDAYWCSSDPVCTESGLHGGQGIDGLNIAACHCCALLPETSCEYFNSYLDRSIVVSAGSGNFPAFFDHAI
jgi:Domain of unknown function (DUF1998)